MDMKRSLKSMWSWTNFYFSKRALIPVSQKEPAKSYKFRLSHSATPVRNCHVNTKMDLFDQADLLIRRVRSDVTMPLDRR